jgi:hypothetical protein
VLVVATGVGAGAGVGVAIGFGTGVGINAVVLTAVVFGIADAVIVFGVILAIAGVTTSTLVGVFELNVGCEAAFLDELINT